MDLMDMQELQKKIHENAVRKGFWESDNIPEKLCLIHSEVSEALEEYREYNMKTILHDTTTKPIGFPSELADIVIRVLDLSEKLGIDLQKEIIKKYAYNLTRPYKHGGKRV